MPGVEHGLEEFGGALGVDADVAADLVHGLADAYGGGEVVDDVDAAEDFAHAIGVADVADDELDLSGEVVRAGRRGGPAG